MGDAKSSASSLGVNIACDAKSSSSSSSSRASICRISPVNVGVCSWPHTCTVSTQLGERFSNMCGMLARRKIQQYRECPVSNTPHSGSLLGRGRTLPRVAPLALPPALPLAGALRVLWLHVWPSLLFCVFCRGRLRCPWKQRRIVLIIGSFSSHYVLSLAYMPEGSPHGH